MRTVEKYLIALFFFICPVEIAVHLLITSSAKYVGLLILLAEVIILLKSGSEAIIYMSPSVIAILLWLTYCCISLNWVTINGITYEYITTYVMMGIFTIISTVEIWEEKDIRLYLCAYMSGSLLLALIVMFFGGGGYTDRETIVLLGKECDPNQASANLIPGAILCLNFAIKKNKTKLLNILGYIGTFVCIYSVFLTGSRGGFISLSVSSVATLIIAERKGKISSVNLTAVVIFGVFVYIYAISTQAWRVLDFDSYTSTYGNGSGRIVLWKALLNSFDIKWLWGHGVGSTANYYRTIFGEISGVHNTFLLVLYEVGFLGFAFFIFPYITMLFHFRKNEVLFPILIGALICAFFLDALNLRYIWNGLILCLMEYNFKKKQEIIEHSTKMQHRYLKND